jgi:hypothetical protein
MSDPSGRDEEEDGGRVRPRHETAAERRSSETVMLNSENLGDMVAEAKGDPEPAGAAPVAPPAAEEEEQATQRNVVLIVGVALIVVVAFAVLWLIYR